MAQFKIFLLFGVMCALELCSAQKLNFPYGLTYQNQNYVGNWSTDGTVELSDSDLIMFEPQLDVQMCSTICTIDLTKCSMNVDEQNSPNSCYCKHKSGNELDVHIGSVAKPAHGGQIIQAVLPSKPVFQPVTASRILGKLPPIAETMISFRKFPDEVQMGLTQTMTISCEVQRHNGKPRAVTSIIIFRNGTEELAKVTDTGAVKGKNSNLKVKGELLKKGDNLAYIELTWKSPTDKQMGVYECKVDAIDSSGDNISFSSTLVVGNSVPTMEELVKRLQDLNNEKETMKHKFEKDIQTIKSTFETEIKAMKSIFETTIRTMQTSLGDVNKRIGQSEHDKKSTAAELSELKKSSKKELAGLENLRSQEEKTSKGLVALKTKVVEISAPRHVETGVGQCGYSKYWTATKPDVNHIVHYKRYLEIKFKQPYKKTPIVTQGIIYGDHHQAHTTRYNVIISKIDRYGFTVTCETWKDSIVYGLGFSWLSISSEE